MARYEVLNDGSIGATISQADMLCELGMMYAAGRDCEIDLVTAHKWLNIAAIKGSERAAHLRGDLAERMPKLDLVKALRAAREWMGQH